MPELQGTSIFRTHAALDISEGIAARIGSVTADLFGQVETKDKQLQTVKILAAYHQFHAVPH